MSSTFDTMQYALSFLRDKIGDEDSHANDVIYCMQKLIERLHDYSHQHEDMLNRGSVVGNTPDLLRTALQHDDEDERREWLRRRERV